MESYLNHLKNRFLNNYFPHEIGIFLGYPLKDVEVFMGFSDQKLTKINGWRVYGDPEISDTMANVFKLVRNKVTKLLINHSPENVLAIIQ